MFFLSFSFSFHMGNLKTSRLSTASTLETTEFHPGRIWPPGHMRVGYLWDQASHIFLPSHHTFYSQSTLRRPPWLALSGSTPTFLNPLTLDPLLPRMTTLKRKCMSQFWNPNFFWKLCEAGAEKFGTGCPSERTRRSNTPVLGRSRLLR